MADRINRQLIYIDPGYKVDVGHFIRMGAFIHEEADEQGIELRHYVNMDVPEETALEMGLIRKFNYLAGLSWLDEPKDAFRDFSVKLDEILEELSSGKGKVEFELFMYTADPQHLPVIAYLINKHSGKKKSFVAHVCIFYRNPDFCLPDRENDEYKDMLGDLSKMIEKVDPDRRLTVCSDSERTNQLYQPYFEREIKLLHIPIEKVSKTPFAGERSAKITIGYIGLTAKRAGYDLLYEVYKRISSSELSAEVHFKIKHTPREQLKDIYEEFLLEKDSITHIDGFISNEEIERFFSDCDVIVIPYSKRNYSCETSGIVTEALFKNKIVIVPADTWLSDQIEEFGSGETFVSDDAQSLFEALEKVIRNFDHYRLKCDRRIEEYRALHSSANLFKELGLSSEPTEVESEGLLDARKISLVESLEGFLAEYQCLLYDRYIQVGLTRKKEEKIKWEMHKQIKAKQEEIKAKQEEIKDIKQSLSWKITKPLRWLGSFKGK